MEQYSRFELESEKNVGFIAPSGKIITVKSFVKQPIKFEYDDEGQKMLYLPTRQK